MRGRSFDDRPICALRPRGESPLINGALVRTPLGHWAILDPRFDTPITLSRGDRVLIQTDEGLRQGAIDFDPETGYHCAIGITLEQGLEVRLL